MNSNAPPGKNRPRSIINATLVLACFTIGATLAGCREGSAAPKGQIVQQGAAPSDLPAVLATLGDEQVTLADVRGRVGDRLDQLEVSYRRARDKAVQSALDSIVHERLMLVETKKSGKTADELLAAEAGAAGLEPTGVDVETWYKENQAKVGNRSLELLRPQIVEYLRKQRRTDAADKLDRRLMSDLHVSVKFEPYRLQFANDKAPTIGKTDAPVTLVEFSDFQCPYCKSAVPTLKEIEKTYGDKVQIVYRQFPLTSIHPFAFKAAEASLCANEQGKFWQLHDVMFNDQTKLGVSDLKQQAASLGMDEKKFTRCLDTGKYVEQIQNDLKEGQRIGVNGTPAIFINGTLVDGGAVPFTVISPLIDKELARSKH